MFKLIGADGKEYGPVSADQLRQWIAEGRANYETFVLAENGVEWRPLGAFAEFAGALAAAAPPAFSPLASNAPMRTNGMAIAGFVLGLFSVFSCVCCCCSTPAATLGLIFSSMGLSRVNTGQAQGGRGMAIAGILLSILGLLLSLGAMYLFMNDAGDQSMMMDGSD